MPIYKCVNCGKEWHEGCDSISGWRVIIIYTVCDECMLKTYKTLIKLAKEYK